MCEYDANSLTVSTAITMTIGVSATKKAGLAVGSCRHSMTTPIANTEAPCMVRKLAMAYAALIAEPRPCHRLQPVQTATGTMKPRSTMRIVQNALGESRY